ncbi:MAG: TonB-dependent receptor [Halioglobus sp.]
MLKLKHTPLCLAVSAVVATMGQPVLAQDSELVMEEVITIGTRSSKPRSATDSPVPVDVFSSEDLNVGGNTADITDSLKSLVPSYTASPATGDGSAFVRHTSLRGMSPDQSLVLVNGKRRHRSSLVQDLVPAAGRGAHAPDIAMVPSMGVKSVEILRDGAAAQYGSDAIAGVINFQMKDDNEGGEVMVQYGEYFDDEQSMKVGANGGFALGENAFLNLTLEYVDNDALSRGIQRPDAQSSIDDFGAQGVGGDSPFGDAPFVNSWGRPETEATRFFFNSGYDISDAMRVYAFGNYAETEGRYRFFWREGRNLVDSGPDGLDGTLLSLRDDHGYDGDLLETGYTPFLDGEQDDISLVLGLKGEFGGDLYYDISGGYGQNTLDFTLNNTTNHSLGLGDDGEPLQTTFNTGGYEQEETNLNADFSMPLSDAVNLAFGAEWREETFTINPGEPSSYFEAGSSGMLGFFPRNSGDFSRDNWGIYTDVEWDITDDFLLQGALRYEDFSDFGDTTNGKLAARWNISDAFTLRAAVSTGFHAPTPGQSNLQSTTTTFDGITGELTEEGLLPPTSPIAVLNGGKALTEEKAVNYSIGFTSNFGESTSLTVDVYQIEVEDRIYRTGDINVIGTVSDTISFYTNALDVESSGIDIVLTSGWEWGSSASTDLSLAVNFSEFEVTDQSAVQRPGGLEPVLPVSRRNVLNIENNLPEERFVVSANTFFGDNWNLMIRANYYGDHYDEAGTVGGALVDDNDPSQGTIPGSASQKIDDTIFFDLELGWNVTDNVRLTAGGVNIFDEFVDETDSPFRNNRGSGLQYPRRSAANYEGGSWYMRAAYRW